MTLVKLKDVIKYMERYAQTHTDDDILLIDVANGLLEHFIEKEGEKMNLLEYFETLSDEDFERDIQRRIDSIAVISARLGIEDKEGEK